MLANKSSLSRRKLVYGVGINDADYVVNPTVGGRRVICRFYQSWLCMLTRCYSVKSLKSHPEYVGCSVCDEWLAFSAFKALEPIATFLP